MIGKKARSILDELDSFVIPKDRESVLESRATHVIQSAINLINLIRENYDETTATELERRIINSIKGQDISKFTRGVRRLKDE